MRERYSGRGLMAGAVLLMAVTAAGCQSSEGASEGTAEDGIRVVNVEVTPVVPDGFTEFIRITGEVEALHDVTLSAEEGGRIAAFRVPKGAAVGAGQVIAELDAEVLRAQVAEARAAADLAREQFERQRRLWEDEKIGSEIAYLQTKANAEVAAARLATLEARLDRTAIRAPVAGVFDEKFAEAGEMAMPGTRIARVVTLDRVKITGGVPERYALAVRPGDAATITFDVLPGRTFQGRIGFLGAGVDPVNRTLPLEVVMENPGRLVKPRMVANVQVVRERLSGVIVVPQQVVQRTENGYQVFIVVDTAGGRPTARARPVTLGPSYDNRVVVTDGLAAGDLLVTLGHQLVDDGTRVRVVSAPANPAPDARKDAER
jgi:membrane fusion protein (multidrug efflux system)